MKFLCVINCGAAFLEVMNTFPAIQVISEEHVSVSRHLDINHVESVKDNSERVVFDRMRYFFIGNQ